MAQWHLDEIENSMNQIGWVITKRIESSASSLGGWIIKRQSERFVDFDGIFDHRGNTIKMPSLDKAYACGIRDTQISLYFYKKGKNWNESLQKFVDEMKELK